MMGTILVYYAILYYYHTSIQAKNELYFMPDSGSDAAV